MPIDSPYDPRTLLVRTKYFSLHPKPLERWLWQLGLPQAAERVFWLHWEAGMRSGDWCSEIPIKLVARECSVDASTVTRAYQLLKTKGLIRREDPGRDPNNPFCQATAITEVRLPREFITELSRSPSRPLKETMSDNTRRVNTPSGHQHALPAAPVATNQAPAAPSATISSDRPPAQAPRIPRPSRPETQAMWRRASDTERTRFYEASRDRLTNLEFDTNTRLTLEDRGQILAQLAQLAIAKPTMAAPAPKAAKEPYAGPRRLTVLELARARKRVLETVPESGAPEVLRQIIWAVEHGALRRFAIAMAINIALKKLREGAWSKPNRMPPNWLTQTPNRQRAAPEQCSAA